MEGTERRRPCKKILVYENGLKKNKLEKGKS